MLSSIRQLERSYWAALEDSSTPEKYKMLESDLFEWRAAYKACDVGMGGHKTSECLTPAIIQFGDALDTKFSDAMEDMAETDELFEAAQRSLSALEQALFKNLDACRIDADTRFDDGARSVNAIASDIVHACHDSATGYVKLLLSEQDGSVLYILKENTATPQNLRKVTDERYGLKATVPYVLSQRAARKRAP